MKKQFVLVSMAMLALNSLAFTMDDIKNWSGEGECKAALVLQFNVEGESKAMVFGYRFNEADAPNGYDMVHAIDENNPRLKVEASSHSSMGAYITGFGWDANNDGTIETTGTNDWYRAGWSTSGYWAYFLKNSFDDANWEYSNVGASSRKITNGVVDAWNYGNGMDATWKELEAAPANEVSTGVNATTIAKSVASVSYINLQGVQASEPFEGVNVKVVTYSDGTRKVSKIMK